MAELILIDLSGIFWASWHATIDQEVSAAYENTLATVRRLAHGYEHVAICMDAPPYLRKKLCPEYKAQRDAPAPQAIEQFSRVKRRLAADGFLLWSVEGYEADDVIATAVTRAIDDRLPVTIASGDKDLLQLVDDSLAVQLLKPSDGTVFRNKDVISKFGVLPWQMRDLLALMGDKSDNIPGVPGIGPKTAAKLLHDFDDIDGLLRELETLPAGKVRSSLVENVTQLTLSRKLVTLHDNVPINWEKLFQERAPEKLTEEDMGDIDEADDIGKTEEAAPAEVIEHTLIMPGCNDPIPEAKPDALAVRSNGGVQVFEQGLQPGTLGAAYKLARGLYESRLYSRFPNPEAIWAVIIRGREMGIGALTALDTFHVIEGKPAPSAHLLISRAKQHPDCEYFQFISGDATHAEYETKNRRNPKPTRLKYTLEQAKKADLLRTKSGKPSNWQMRPEEMLRKTAAVQLARIEYPEALLGAYAVEELE
jgi:5'-3' exonuclease